MKNNSGIRPYSKGELAALYEVSPRAFYTMLKPFEQEVGEKFGRYYNIIQVCIIFDKLGIPPCLLPDEYEVKVPVKQSILKMRGDNPQRPNKSI